MSPHTCFLCARSVQLRQKKVTKEKATPSLRPLRCATGQTCVGAVAGCAVELALRCAHRSDNHGESVHEACALRRACHPATAPPQAQPAGGGQPSIQQPNSHAGLCFARPPLAGASASRCAGGAERSDGPCGCPIRGSPSRCAEERRAWGGTGVEAPVLRELTRCGCPSEARSA